jgi:hypothetical protein
MSTRTPLLSRLGGCFSGDTFRMPISILALIFTVLTLNGCKDNYVMEWKRPNPRRWAIVTWNVDVKRRVLINTKVVEKNPTGVHVLVRVQEMSQGEALEADVPKPDESTDVMSLNCTKGSHMVIALGRRPGVVEEMPSDLPLAVAGSAIQDADPTSFLGAVHDAGCFLAGYK